MSENTVVKRTTCAVCGSCCPVDVYVEDGKIVRVEGKQGLCPKGAAARQYVYHPDRILYPMKQIGKKGEGHFERITWEEAYEMMASQEVVVVDVRTREEYDGGHIENAILVPNESIGSEMPEALPDKEATLLIYCRSGRRSKDAAQKLLALGYQSVYDFGGVIDWPYELVKEG